MSTEMPTKVEALSVQNALEGPHEVSHESAHGKFSSAHGKLSSVHGNVHESVLGQFFTVSGSTPTPWSGPFRDHGLRPWSPQKTLEIKGFLGLERPILDLVS